MPNSCIRDLSQKKGYIQIFFEKKVQLNHLYFIVFNMLSKNPNFFLTAAAEFCNLFTYPCGYQSKMALYSFLPIVDPKILNLMQNSKFKKS